MKYALMTALLFFGLQGHAQTAMTDENITEALKVSADAGLNAAKLAKRKAASAEVKTYAEKMVADLRQNEKDGKRLFKRERIDLDGNEATKKIQQDAQNKIADLKKKDRADFDKAYMQSQIEMHQSLLSELNNTYIPAAQNVELKKYLEETKSHVEANLQQARDISGRL